LPQQLTQRSRVTEVKESRFSPSQRTLQQDRRMDSWLGKRDRSGQGDYKETTGRKFRREDGNVSLDMELVLDVDAEEVLQPMIGYPRPIPHAQIEQHVVDDFILRLLEARCMHCALPGRLTTNALIGINLCVPCVTRLGAALRKKDAQLTSQFFTLLNAEQIKQANFKIDKLKTATLKKCRGEWGLFLASKHQNTLPSLQSFAVTCIAEGRSVLSVA